MLAKLASPLPWAVIRLPLSGRSNFNGKNEDAPNHELPSRLRR